MGTEYIAACESCKEYVDLDKYYLFPCFDEKITGPELRKEIIEPDYRWNFRNGILAHFVAKHNGAPHSVKVISEYENDFHWGADIHPEDDWTEIWKDVWKQLPEEKV